MVDGTNENRTPSHALSAFRKPGRRFHRATSNSLHRGAHRLRANPAQALRALARLPLLQQSTRPYAWRRWFEALGLRADDDLRGPRYELFSMSVQAAVHGMGVALVPDFLADDELRDGRLVQPVHASVDSDRAYFLAIPDNAARHDALSQFTQWLMAAASDQSRSGNDKP